MSVIDSLPPESLAEAERRHIIRALAWTRGNRREAARLLGVARSTLLAKIRRYGLEEITAGSGDVRAER
jgi:DNA-binding NtrC family response regulator